MEALHRQVLPFVLRRMKEDVLSDLPAKITQVNKKLKEKKNILKMYILCLGLLL